jgi:hypothetical protein
MTLPCNHASARPRSRALARRWLCLAALLVPAIAHAEPDARAPAGARRPPLLVGVAKVAGAVVALPDESATPRPDGGAAAAPHASAAQAPPCMPVSRPAADLAREPPDRNVD